MLSCGKYFFKEKLGSGTYGAVYLAENTKTGKKVAIKVSQEKFCDRKNFYIGGSDIPFNEYDILYRLNHPNLLHAADIVSPTDVNRCIDSYGSWVVLDLADTDLDHHLLKIDKKKIDESYEPMLIDMFIQMAKGVLALYTAGYYHLDIKPLNVLMYKSNDYICGYRLVISDFGSSISTSTPFIMYESVTKTYRPPDAEEMAIMTPKIDIYSLGVSFWQIIGYHYENPEKYNPEVVKLIKHMVNPNPKERPDLETIINKLYSHLGASIVIEPLITTQTPVPELKINETMLNYLINELRRYYDDISVRALFHAVDLFSRFKSKFPEEDDEPLLLCAIAITKEIHMFKLYEDIDVNDEICVVLERILGEPELLSQLNAPIPIDTLNLTNEELANYFIYDKLVELYDEYYGKLINYKYPHSITFNHINGIYNRLEYHLM